MDNGFGDDFDYLDDEAYFAYEMNTCIDIPDLPMTPESEVPTSDDELTGLADDLARSYSINVKEDFSHCSILQIYERDFTRWRIHEHAPARNFLNGHPFAKLYKGQHIKYKPPLDPHIFEAIIVDVDIHMGIITLDRPWPVPFVALEDYCVDANAKHVNGVLRDLNFNKNNIDMLQIFSGTLKRPQGDQQYRLLEGVAGSGKTYVMANDIAKLDTDSLIVVVCPTNEGLLSAAEEIIKVGRSPLIFTNDKLNEGSWHAYFKGDLDYDVFIAQLHSKNKSKDFKDYSALIRSNMKKKLLKHVILCTPVMARSFYTMFRMKNEYVNIFIDEAGLMKMIDLLPLLFYKFKRLWLYGDKRQNKPMVPESDEFDTLEKIVRKIDKYINISVSSWFDFMDIPKCYLNVCRRLPPDSATCMVDFFYEDSFDVFKNYVRRNTLELEVTPCVSYMPRSLMMYPFMPNEEKEIEASRLNSLVKYIMVREKKKEPINVVVTHNYLKDALQEVYQKEKKRRNTDLVDLLPIHTSYLAQSKTFKNVIFLTPNTPSTFLDDRLFLVAASRHTVSFTAANLKTSRFYPFKLLFYLAKMRLITFFASYPKNKYRRDHKKFGTHVTLHITWPEGVLQSILMTGLYDKLLKLSTYDESSPNLQIWKILNSGLLEDVKSFKAGTYIMPDAMVEPSYKWIFIYPPKQKISLYRRQNSGRIYLNDDKTWTEIQNQHSIKVDFAQ